MSLEIQVVGLRRLGQAMNKLASEDVPNGVKQAGMTAAELVAEEARAIAPRGHAPRDKHPGQLAGSVRPRATLSGARVEIGGHGIRYAAAAHWGWKRPYRRHGKTISHKPQMATRFLVVALERRRGEVVDLFARKVREAVGRLNSR